MDMGKRTTWRTIRALRQEKKTAEGESISRGSGRHVTETGGDCGAEEANAPPPVSKGLYGGGGKPSNREGEARDARGKTDRCPILQPSRRR